VGIREGENTWGSRVSRMESMQALRRKELFILLNYGKNKQDCRLR